jgi:hypothetical protein
MASSRRAHQVLGIELPSVGEWAATSPHIKHMSKQSQGERRVRHLLGVWAATSRVRHLSKRGAPPKPHVLNLPNMHQSTANQVILSPLTP